MKYFTADHHFGNKNIIRYCNRPFRNAREMDSKLIQLHNSIVKAKDTVYLIGDLTLFGMQRIDYIKNIVNTLNGQLHLVLGNHDSLKPFAYVDLGIRTVHTSLIMEEHNLILHHDPAAACIDKTKTWLCGHIHDLFKVQNHVINVGVDVWEYKPVSLEEIKRIRREC